MPTIGLLLTGHLSWNWLLLGSLVFVVGCYLFLVNKQTELRLTSQQPIVFIVGIVLSYIIIGSPLAVISYLSFSLHMLQMSILYFIIPPLLLLGIPLSLYQKLLSIPIVHKFPRIRHASRTFLYLFAVLFLLYHLPFLLTVLVKTPILKSLYLFILFLLSFGMWWPMVSPDPQQRLPVAEMKRYAMTSGYILLPACLLFILTAFMDAGNNPLLNQLVVHLCLPPDLGASDVLPSPFNTKYDQALSGFLMLGLHKASLVMVVKLEGKVQE
ncbi:cytochrome c oxidase assembly protein [Sporosarcina oncorhynchi]|uniref:Cytochrome c oxidase assembly protein n=1 Tax=Sporosarcina oncorhynchi TaxID=3056444 RepID=A0ABZ0L5F9_9BACL|nr:cytochrome c oxidase assembly protein [Sporosarcina sp. T2O-4]WOV87713.1 cytochrome c oxidase assembly protein [Sporosarcina sp. T2O-4]